MDRSGYKKEIHISDFAWPSLFCLAFFRDASCVIVEGLPIRKGLLAFTWSKFSSYFMQIQVKTL
jgi:hypothetical protein